MSVAQKIELLTMFAVQCSINRDPQGLQGMTVLNDETMDWLLNT